MMPRQDHPGDVDGGALALTEITAESLQSVLRLGVSPGQEGFVAPNAISIAEAHFEPAAWFRAITLDGAPVGFAMIYDPALPGAEPEYGPDTIMLWRFMVDARHQSRGIGRRALSLLICHARTRPGITRLATSYVPGDGSPRDFYRRCGFVETGQILEDETEAVLAL